MKSHKENQKDKAIESTKHGSSLYIHTEVEATRVGH